MLLKLLLKETGIFLTEDSRRREKRKSRYMGAGRVFSS